MVKRSWCPRGPDAANSEVDCGDSYVNSEAGEECDGERFYDDNGTPTQVTEDTCLQCTANTCGDDVVWEMTLAGSYVCGWYPDDPACQGLPPEEECDDGDTDPGDGCNATCQDE